MAIASRRILFGAVAVALAIGTSGAVDGGADDIETPASSGANVYRLTVPAVAGGARIDVPEPYQRDHRRPLLLLDATVFAVPVVDMAGNAGIQISETLTEAYYVWFPGMGRAASFMGHPEYHAGTGGYVYDLGWTRLIAFTGDEDTLARLADGTYKVPECVPQGAKGDRETSLRPCP